MLTEYMKQRLAMKQGKAAPAQKAKAKPIARKSEKRIADAKVYKKLVKEKMAASKKCEVCSPVCVIVSSGLHHKQKRSPKNLLDPNNLIRACSPCNSYIEQFPDWAIENGHTVSRFAVARAEKVNGQDVVVVESESI